jgi:hypothetical protein
MPLAIPKERVVFDEEINTVFFVVTDGENELRMAMVYVNSKDTIAVICQGRHFGGGSSTIGHWDCPLNRSEVFGKLWIPMLDPWGKTAEGAVSETSTVAAHFFEHFPN